MSKGRLEAFSDGVIAIVITIMVLELKPPVSSAWVDVRHTLFTLLLYLFSFIVVGIYWTNHHHMFHAAKDVTGGVLWANLHLLFWLSLIPFATKWMGESHFSSFATAVYGFVFLTSAIAYTVLQSRLIAHEGPTSRLALAVGSDRKGKMSLALYAIGIAVAFVQPLIADALYVAVALIWLVPDPRIESRIAHEH